MNMISRSCIACLALAWTMTAGAAEDFTSQSCRASAALDYFQRGAEAEAEITVDTPHCRGASGSFVVEVTIKADAADETEKLAFAETWKRDDDQAVVMQRRYSIGDNVQLLRIRLRKLTCSCNEETSVD